MQDPYSTHTLHEWGETRFPFTGWTYAISTPDPQLQEWPGEAWTTSNITYWAAPHNNVPKTWDHFWNNDHLDEPEQQDEIKYEGPAGGSGSFEAGIDTRDPMGDDDLLALLAQPPEINGGFWEREHERMLNPLKEVLDNMPAYLFDDDEVEKFNQAVGTTAQYGLDIGGFAPPPAGPIADLTSAASAYERGDYFGAGLGVAAAVPGVGLIFNYLKFGRHADKAVDAVKVAADAADETPGIFQRGYNWAKEKYQQWFPSAKVAKTDVPESAYDIAKAGGKHEGMLKNYLDRTPKQIRNGIDSYEKEIQEHLDKIANPEKYVKNFKQLDPRHQENLLKEKWPSDIKRLQEQKSVLEGLLNSIMGQ